MNKNLFFMLLATGFVFFGVMNVNVTNNNKSFKNETHEKFDAITKATKSKKNKIA